MDLFVYGTLRAPALMAAVSGRQGLLHEAASLDGFGVYPVAGDVVPFIAKNPSAIAEGMLFRGLGPAQMARLDLYEGAFGYRLVPVVVNTDAGAVDAMCYLPPNDVATGQGAWSPAVWEADHLAPALLAVQELFSNDPLPTTGELRRMWPMIEARAWSKHRAKPAPATQRFAPTVPDSFVATQNRPPQGRFFRFESVDVTHRRFDGSKSPVLKREAFFGIDAAMVLPYDPVRDRVLLVEQARIGPALRHDPNPWMLEPVAGIVDARETPRQTALRECQEEADLAIAELVPAGEFYVSPGATTDYFYTFIGLADLPQEAPYFGGLDAEGEDLRLHPVAFNRAMELADSGEIATGPALYLLHWLLRHKDHLCAKS